MHLEPLPAIILAIAEQRSLNSVLASIIETCARQPNVALARIWLQELDEKLPSLFYCSKSLAGCFAPKGKLRHSSFRNGRLVTDQRQLSSDRPISQ